MIKVRKIVTLGNTMPVTMMKQTPCGDFNVCFPRPLPKKGEPNYFYPEWSWRGNEPVRHIGPMTLDNPPKIWL